MISKTITIREIYEEKIPDNMFIKTFGRIIEIISNDYLRILISHENHEIYVRLYDDPPHFLHLIREKISVGDIILVIGYVKEISNIVYILAKGVQKISRKRIEYLLLRRAFQK